MKLVIGGTIAILLGIIGLTAFFSHFLKVVCGVVPLILIIGGVLVMKMKFDEDAEEASGMFDGNAESEPYQSEEKAFDVEPTEIPAADQTNADDVQSSEIEPIKPASGYVGNEDSFVFHAQDCKYAASKKCTAVFESPQDAIKKGYKPCSICKP